MAEHVRYYHVMAASNIESRFETKVISNFVGVVKSENIIVIITNKMKIGH